MIEDDAYCAALVREADRDRYLAALFAPQRHRSALLALHAFDLETAQVATRVRDPLAGEIRLQWWHDVIGGVSADQAGGHPVAARLLRAIVQYRLRPEPFFAMIEARRRELDEAPFRTLGAFAAYARDGDGTLLELATRILSDGPYVEVDGLAANAGFAVSATRIIGNYPHQRARGKTFVPLDLLARNGVRISDMLADDPLHDVRAALKTLAREGLAALGRTRTLLPTLPAEAWPALLPLAPLRPALSAAMQETYDPLQPARIPMWRRQWILWRASRNLARAL
ncbi:MAG: squalene/phytoene synthase family protein [Pseudorhodoplanes sp.]|nr:squalene/phytoene synthase family protein [Pseudorhodoplanes sp.]